MRRNIFINCTGALWKTKAMISATLWNNVFIVITYQIINECFLQKQRGLKCSHMKARVSIGKNRESTALCLSAWIEGSWRDVITAYINEGRDGSWNSVKFHGIAWDMWVTYFLNVKIYPLNFLILIIYHKGTMFQNELNCYTTQHSV